MAAVLLQVLERTELNKLPKGVQNKLEKFVTELQNANEALKTQHERFKADSEQQYFDIDKRLAESQEQILSATRDLQTLKEENKKLSELIHTTTITTHFLSFGYWGINDVKRLNEKLTETSKVKMELQLKLDDIQSTEHREKRMEQEKELLEKKIEWVTAELQTKTEELLKTNREKGKEILELQGSLKNSKDQVTRLENQLSTLKETAESQTKRATDLINKLKQAKDEQSAMEEKYRNELNAHVKLSSLYKGAATDTESKNQELSRAVEELSMLVKETGEANKTLEKKVLEGEELKTQLEAEFREKIKKMEKELENATMKTAGAPSLTEEQLDFMCPSAAAIAAIVKPGMKFFDLYNAYAECQTQLQLEKQETRRVSRVLDEIVQEVESKAPVLKRQREEYESMQRSMASLCNKLEQARTLFNKSVNSGLMKLYNMTIIKTQTNTKDTCRLFSFIQVCALLVELEEARGNRVTKGDGSSTNISSTSEVISSQQLSFRSVEELQRQNQSLLGRLRVLEEEKDRQKTLDSAGVNKLQKEVEQLREQRNQQKQLADSSARQRDMYKALLTQSTGFSLPSQDSSSQSAPVRISVPATRSTPQRAAAAESAQTAQTKAALKQLNDAFTLYKKEKAENDRMLNETNDKLQKQLTELRSSHAKVTSQLEFSNKRYEMLQETVSAYRREICALQDRSQKMAATAQRHEHIIHTMSQDLRQANEKLALEEVRVENLTKERDMLRQAESRLNRDKEAMLAEQRNQNLLLTNLKTIQLTMERTETDTRQRLNNKIEHLEAEVASMKTRLDLEVAQRHSLGRTMDAQLLEAKKQLETQNTLQQKTRELLRSSEQQVAALRAQVASQPSQSEQELIEVKGLLRTAEEQKNELAEQLKNANANVEQYRAVVLTLEDSLKKEKESRSPLEIRLKESEEVQKQLEKRILEVEKIKQHEQEQKRKAIDAVEKQVLELQRNLKFSQAEQQDALERATAAVTLEQKAIQDSLLQTKLAGEAQAKYERELMLHAADVEALQELKKRFQIEASKKRELEEQINKTSSILQEKTAALNSLERQLKDDLSNKNRRCEELGKQNALLHQQMDEMASKSRQVQQQHQQLHLDLSFSEEGKTTEQILEILRFVRREKEIAVARCEASEEEALRHKQRVEHQDRELKELQEALNTEREKMQATSKTLSQQEEQLKKIETIGALQESNRMLKMDRDKLEQELQQAQAKVTKLQSDISPLHQSLSVLSEKNGSLQADKRILEEDLKRWKAKTQQLISQQKDGDVEERQKITNEREAQQRRIAQFAEETAKLKTELARSSASSNSAQSQLQGLRDSVARLTSERDALKKDLETKNSDILEKNKTITQVKKIGRRYKTQYEELKAQHDKVGLESTITEHEAEIKHLQEQLMEAKQAKEAHEATQDNQNQNSQSIQASDANVAGDAYQVLQEEIAKLRQELAEGKNREEQLRQQMADKEEKTKKVFMGAKTKINQLNSAKEQLSQEVEELKQSKEEVEVRMNALKSQYEGRFLRLDRELRELRETQAQTETREEPQDQSGAKARSADQRQVSLKSPGQDRGSSSLSDPPTANIRPTPSTPSPSNKPSPSTGSKATPRASIRPMVTPAAVPIPTPTATVMPTTQTDSQEVLMSAGASVHSTSSTLVSTPTSIPPTSSQATAFVQPTQQQAASQDAGPSVEAERPSTSSSLIGPGEQDLLSSVWIKLLSFLHVPQYKEEEEEDDEDEDEPGDCGMRGGEESNEDSREAEEEGGEEEPSEASNTEENMGEASSDSQRPSEPSHSSEHPSTVQQRHIRVRPPERPCAPRPNPLPLLPLLPHTPSAPPTQAPTPAPSPAVHPTSSSGAGTPSLTGTHIKLQHFFDDDDRMVPSTPTLVVPHRNDGFAEAIHSPQVAGLSTRFRFGPPEDLLPQTSASHSDLGQLASQGGLGMYESPLFLAAHDEDGGGRSVPTTPLQVAAPVTVFTESLPSDSGDNLASQSVPMVTASTGMASAADDGDEVFMEQEGEGPGIESSLESQADVESSGQQSDDASLPSTSQDPGNLFC
uniref:Translocated promoter region, nuclear basket protein n=1 Tax=Sparus aurata TaxID=8175 RepID=A0A671VH99_SPAAU